MNMYGENTDKSQGLYTLSVQEPVPGYQHTIRLCSHLELTQLVTV